mgnify:CR=1 FL=1
MNKLAFQLGWMAKKADNEYNHYRPKFRARADHIPGDTLSSPSVEPVFDSSYPRYSAEADARMDAAMKAYDNIPKRVTGTAAQRGKNILSSETGAVNPAMLTRMGAGLGAGIATDFIGNYALNKAPQDNYFTQVGKNLMPIVSGTVGGVTTAGPAGAAWGAAGGAAAPIYNAAKSGIGLAGDLYSGRQNRLDFERRLSQASPKVQQQFKAR